MESLLEDSLDDELEDSVVNESSREEAFMSGFPIASFTEHDASDVPTSESIPTSWFCLDTEIFIVVTREQRNFTQSGLDEGSCSRFRFELSSAALHPVLVGEIPHQKIL